MTWIEEAAGRDGGVLLRRDGYPNWYLASARDLLPTIRERRPYEPPMRERPRWGHDMNDGLLPQWLGKTTIDEEEMSSCGADEWLLVEVWDES